MLAVAVGISTAGLTITDPVNGTAYSPGPQQSTGDITGFTTVEVVREHWTNYGMYGQFKSRIDDFNSTSGGTHYDAELEFNLVYPTGYWTIHNFLKLYPQHTASAGGPMGP